MNWNKKDLLLNGYESTGITTPQISHYQMNWELPKQLNVNATELQAFRIDVDCWEVFFKPNANKKMPFKAVAILNL